MGRIKDYINNIDFSKGAVEGILGLITYLYERDMGENQADCVHFSNDIIGILSKRPQILWDDGTFQDIVHGHPQFMFDFLDALMVHQRRNPMWGTA